MPSFNPNYFIHAANLLLVVAYSVRDIMWLRLFAVTSSLISLPYFILQPTPQWAPIGWSLGFAGLNAWEVPSRLISRDALGPRRSCCHLCCRLPRGPPR